MNVPGFKVATVSINYYKNTSLEKAIDRRVPGGGPRLQGRVPTSSSCPTGTSTSTMWPSPACWRCQPCPSTSSAPRRAPRWPSILESAEPREVHHFATLLGYGACAVNPYLAHETIGQLIDQGLLDKDYYAAVEDYNKAILSGIVKIASKMGISTIQSYQSSQIFEAVGISKDVIDKYFTGTVSRVGGIGLADIQADVEAAAQRGLRPAGAGHQHGAGRRRCPQVPQRQGRAPVQPADHPPVPESLLDQRLRVPSSSSPTRWTTWARTGVHLRSLLDFNFDRRRRHPAGRGGAGVLHRQALQGRPP